MYLIFRDLAQVSEDWGGGIRDGGAMYRSKYFKCVCNEYICLTYCRYGGCERHNLVRWVASGTWHLSLLSNHITPTERIVFKGHSET